MGESLEEESSETHEENPLTENNLAAEYNEEHLGRDSSEIHQENQLDDDNFAEERKEVPSGEPLTTSEKRGDKPPAECDQEPLKENFSEIDKEKQSDKPVEECDEKSLKEESHEIDIQNQMNDNKSSADCVNKLPEQDLSGSCKEEQQNEVETTAECDEVPLENNFSEFPKENQLNELKPSAGYDGITLQEDFSVYSKENQLNELKPSSRYNAIPLEEESSEFCKKNKLNELKHSKQYDVVPSQEEFSEFPEENQLNQIKISAEGDGVQLEEESNEIYKENQMNEDTPPEEFVEKPSEQNFTEFQKENQLNDDKPATERDEVYEMELSELVEPQATSEIAEIADEDEPAVDKEIAESDEEPAVDKEIAESDGKDSKRSSGKRKRGKTIRVQSKLSSRKKDEEDVCFICFDGGDLVLCDRRYCPKAYHPSCVNRDEAFFRSKGRWNCGWHICSNCEKAARYMCYTCTYSLCKVCIKEGGFFCVRGNKGLCETCMTTVMLIEKNHANEEINKEMADIDFDDRNNWEYLFKDYWLSLKQNLSISFDELTGARNLWKGSEVPVRNEESSEELHNVNDDTGSNSDNSVGDLDQNKVATKRTKKQSKSKSSFNEEASSSLVQTANNEETKCLKNDAQWASKELLEFVAHMRDGDESTLSQFDVQELLLEYIKRNKLRDPRKKSQIICDFRLENLFGKSRVGHFEMLKLLESHFLSKEISRGFTDEIQGGIIDAEEIRLDTDIDSIPKSGSEKKRKKRKSINERRPQTNINDFAAIDVHNINLIYLRRNLMEDLLVDMDNFHDKVVGSFVRIRISGIGQKQDIYRLVQVVGTHQVADLYKAGKRTTNTVLEILNLDKTEVISIDTISNQDFTEEECKRLRQSIKCGLINILTVGEVQEKARALQSVRVNDMIEAEILRLSHLRDRASEKGRRKELRECIEKLQVLKTLEERERRLQELPEVHSDPNMDPNYESDEDDRKLINDNNFDNSMKPKISSFNRKGKNLIASSKQHFSSNEGQDIEGKKNSKSDEGQDISGSWQKQNILEKSKIQIHSTDSNALALNTRTAIESKSSTAVSDSSLALSSMEALVKCNETEKIWHYQDPSGKIQGPFSMTQLRKWSTTGYFPADLKIWKASQTRDEAILLTDALAKQFNEVPQPQSMSQPQVQHSSSQSNLEVSPVGSSTSRSDAIYGDETQKLNLNNADNHREDWSGPRNSSKSSVPLIRHPQNGSPRWNSPSDRAYRHTSHQGRDTRDGRNSRRWNHSYMRGNTLSNHCHTGTHSSDHDSQSQSSGNRKAQEENNSSNRFKPSAERVNSNYGNKNDSLPSPTTPNPLTPRDGNLPRVHDTEMNTATAPHPPDKLYGDDISRPHQEGRKFKSRWSEQPLVSAGFSVESQASDIVSSSAQSQNEITYASGEKPAKGGHCDPFDQNANKKQKVPVPHSIEVGFPALGNSEIQGHVQIPGTVGLNQNSIVGSHGKETISSLKQDTSSSALNVSSSSWNYTPLPQITQPVGETPANNFPIPNLPVGPSPVPQNIGWGMAPVQNSNAGWPVEQTSSNPGWWLQPGSANMGWMGAQVNPNVAWPAQFQWGMSVPGNATINPDPSTLIPNAWGGSSSQMVANQGVQGNQTGGSGYPDGLHVWNVPPS